MPVPKIGDVIQALRASHPYEEPAFDLIALAAAPVSAGLGRIGSLAKPTAVSQLVDRLKSSLEISSVLLAGDANREVTKIAMCAGAGGELLDDAIAAGGEVYLTGELRHHDAIKAELAGMTALCTLHSNSERPVLRRLKSRLEALLVGSDQPKFLLSQTDRDPFSIR